VAAVGEEFPKVPKQFSALGGVSLAVALLQSLCTAVFAISGIRVVIGLTALAAVSGVYGPARGYHQDAIRIPMLIFAAAGALINLGVLGWIWHLRTQGSAQWRRRELSRRQKRSERLQVALAVVTLILVGLETWTHHKMHRSGAPPSEHASMNEIFPGRPGSFLM
jgi:ABC-type xylose transport system permease subunit